MKKTTKQLANDVVKLTQEGLTSRALAARLGIGKSTVNRILKERDVNVERSVGGRPAKLSELTKRNIAHSLNANQADSAAEATKKFITNWNQANENKVQFSAQTVRRGLRSIGWGAKKVIKKPLVSIKNRRARLRWCHAHAQWTVEDWKRVIWSDESKFNRVSSDGKRYVWVPLDNEDQSKRFAETMKFGGGSVMVHGMFSWLGAGKLTQIHGLMDRFMYRDILQAGLIPTIQACGILPGMPQAEDIIFQQDNDPKHKSKLLKTWFADKKIHLLDWPSQSPDLNPIENLWAIIKRRLAKRPRPRSVQELWTNIQEEWANISVETCQNLIESMPRRIAECIKQKGRPTGT